MDSLNAINEITRTNTKLTVLFAFTIFDFPERVWRNGSASASQAEGCGFESRRPLQTTLAISLAAYRFKPQLRIVFKAGDVRFAQDDSVS